ncbi:hypothetical protein A4X09_0g2227 [Tilletia walkeri]|uniref:Uncharacterized protein n=1 Tax=Tilletia walkeri TaxID=117179 RepID=A0A8X7T7A5_9BASI|nr:hypothetical protein A4X09_0g2227 [Tilletia walkeri]
MSTPDAAATAAAARDETRATRERFSRLLKQELAIQAAGMSKDEMPSCTTLFDRCIQCFALFPQLNAIYRHGTFSNCEDKLDDWKACLSLRGLDSDEKYRAWIQRRAEMAVRKRMSKQSTEEVWNFRLAADASVVDPDHESEEFPNPPTDASASYATVEPMHSKHAHLQATHRSSIQGKSRGRIPGLTSPSDETSAAAETRTFRRIDQRSLRHAMDHLNLRNW